jgi:MFS family permease
MPKSSAAVAARPYTPYRYVLGVLFCSYVSAFIDRGLLSAAGAPIKHDLNLSDTQFGLLSGPAFVVLYCVCGIPLGWLADRSDRKTVIASGLFIWSVMTAACATTVSFGGFFTARAGVGLGEACLVPAGVALLGGVAPRNQMARSIAIFLMGATAGNAISLLVAGRILQHLGSSLPLIPGVGQISPWRALFLLAALPGIALAFLITRIREPDRASPAVRPLIALRTARRLVYGNRAAYGPVTIATACILVLSQTQAAWMPLFYTRAFHLSAASAAWTVGLLFLVSAPAGQWMGGLLIDRLRTLGMSAAPLFVQAGCAILCIPAAAIFCTSRRMGLSETAYMVFNFLVFAATPAGLTAWQALTPERSRGLVVALLSAAVTLLGVGAGPVLVGALTDHLFQDESSLGLSLLMVIVGAGITAACTALFGSRAFGHSAASARSGDRLI